MPGRPSNNQIYEATYLSNAHIRQSIFLHAIISGRQFVTIAYRSLASKSQKSSAPTNTELWTEEFDCRLECSCHQEPYPITEGGRNFFMRRRHLGPLRTTAFDILRCLWCSPTPCSEVEAGTWNSLIRAPRTSYQPTCMYASFAWRNAC